MPEQTDMTQHPATLELRRVVLKISLVSHAPIQGYELAPSENGRGDRWRKSNRKPPIPHLGSHPAKGGADSSIPRGDVDRKGDRTPEYRQKSHLYFQTRLNGCSTVGEVEALLVEANETLEAWRKTPLLAGDRPMRDHPQWKAWVATCGHPVKDIVRWYGCSRSLVYKIREDYAAG